MTSRAAEVKATMEMSALPGNLNSPSGVFSHTVLPPLSRASPTLFYYLSSLVGEDQWLKNASGIQGILFVWFSPGLPRLRFKKKLRKLRKSEKNIYIILKTGKTFCVKASISTDFLFIWVLSNKKYLI